MHNFRTSDWIIFHLPRAMNVFLWEVLPDLAVKISQKAKTKKKKKKWWPVYGANDKLVTTPAITTAQKHKLMVACKKRNWQPIACQMLCAKKSGGDPGSELFNTRKKTNYNNKNNLKKSFTIVQRLLNF